MNRARLWLGLGLLVLLGGLASIVWAWQRGGLELLQLGMGVC